MSTDIHRYTQIKNFVIPVAVMTRKDSAAANTLRCSITSACPAGTLMRNRSRSSRLEVNASQTYVEGDSGQGLKMKDGVQGMYELEA